MKSKFTVIAITFIALAVTGCFDTSQSRKDAKAVERQQGQYAHSQPVPAYDWSIERDLVIQLYNVRNLKAATHSVWRSDRGLIEGDCASIGFGIPYDTSLTNPLKSTYWGQGGVAVTEQAEPNGIFASKNTSATWVMCAGATGQIEPVYVETKVTVYPYPVTVDYENNRAVKAGTASVTLTSK